MLGLVNTIPVIDNPIISPQTNGLERATQFLNLPIFQLSKCPNTNIITNKVVKYLPCGNKSQPSLTEKTLSIPIKAFIEGMRIFKSSTLNTNQVKKIMNCVIAQPVSREIRGNLVKTSSTAYGGQKILSLIYAIQDTVVV